jgi:hypothetical protein
MRTQGQNCSDVPNMACTVFFDSTCSAVMLSATVATHCAASLPVHTVSRRCIAGARQGVSTLFTCGTLHTRVARACCAQPRSDQQQNAGMYFARSVRISLLFSPILVDRCSFCRTVRPTASRCMQSCKTLFARRPSRSLDAWSSDVRSWQAALGATLPYASCGTPDLSRTLTWIAQKRWLGKRAMFPQCNIKTMELCLPTWKATQRIQPAEIPLLAPRVFHQNYFCHSQPYPRAGHHAAAAQLHLLCCRGTAAALARH